MFKRVAIAFLCFGIIGDIFAEFVNDFTFYPYFRSGTGKNSKGGDQECFNNKGSMGNEFRLGNECGIYGDLAWKIDHFGKKLEKGKVSFSSHWRFEFFPEAHSVADQTNTYRLTELYVSADNVFKNIPLSFWIGKHFYRDVDVHMLDWYYFAEVLGVGGGVKYRTKTGTLALAQLREVSTTRTNKGARGLTWWDFRYFGIPVGKNQELNIWAALAHIPEGQNGNTTYQDSTGSVLGLRHRRKLNIGFNDISLSWGRGVARNLGLNINFDNIYGMDTIDDSYRIRVVEHLTTKIKSAWELHFALVFDHLDSGAAKDSKTRWYSAGVRPVYFFSDKISLATELGHSIVEIESERNKSGQKSGKRTLTRATAALQISPFKGIWARPVLRLFWTKSFWNNANKEFIALRAPAFAGNTNGASLGMQAEVWF